MISLQNDTDRLRRWGFRASTICLFILPILLTSNNWVRVGCVITAGIPLLFGTFAIFKGWLSPNPIRPILIPLGLLIAALLLSSAFSIQPSYSFETFFRQHLWFFLMMLFLGVWGGDPHREAWYFRGLAAAAGLSAIIGIILYYLRVENYVYKATAENNQVYWRAQGLLESYTRSAMLYIVMLPAAAALGLKAYEERRWGEFSLIALTFLVSGWYLLLTKSRGPWGAVAIAVIATLLLLRGRKWMLGVLVGGAILALLVMPAERQRALSLIRDIDQPEILFAYRFTLWEQGWEDIREHPLLGLGHGGNIYLTEAALEPQPGAQFGPLELQAAGYRQPDLHNIYLQTLAEVGIIGFLAYALVIGVLIREGIRRLRDRRRRGTDLTGPSVALSSLAAFLLYGLVAYYNEERVGLMLWMTLGLLLAREKSHSKE